MAYVTYENLPLYFGTSNSTTTLPAATSDGDNRKVAASQVTFNHAASMSVSRYAGGTGTSRNFRVTGPPNISLSFSCFLESGQSEFNPFDYTGQSAAGTTAIIGHFQNGIRLSGLYLTSLSLSVTPYSPVIAQLDFACYSPDSTGYRNISATAQSTTAPSITHSKLVHGAYCDVINDPQNDGAVDLFYVDGTNVGGPSLFESVSYTLTQSHTPIYGIGSGNADVHLNTVEQSMQIQSDEIHSGMSTYTGIDVIPKLRLKGANGQALKHLEVSGLLNSQNVSVSAGDVAKGSLTINSILL
jgi:hypothetical protein